MKKEKYITERPLKGGVCYEVNFRYYDEYGVKKTYTKSFHSKHYTSEKACLAAAIKDRDKARYKLDTVGLKIDTTHTVKDVYELAKELIPLAYETHRKHDLKFKQCIDPFADYPIGKVTAKDITMSLNMLKGKSQNTINNALSVWRRIFKCALLCDYVSVDPTMKVEAPKAEKITTPKSVDMTCSVEDVFNAMINYGRDEEQRFNSKVMAYALMVIAHLGLRPSECYALTKSDIDFKNKTVSINKAVGSNHNSKIAIKITKTPTSIRILPLPSSIEPYFKELAKMQKGEYLFAKYDGGFMHARYVAPRINKVCKRAGLNFRSYMLRHNFSTTLIKNNVDIRTIMELMGHDASSMTLEYARSNMDEKKKAIKRIKV